MKIKKYLSKTIAIFIALSFVLSYTFLFSKPAPALALTWSTPETVASNAAFFDMKLDSQRKVHVVYQTSNEGGCYYTNNVSGSWSTPVLISADIEKCMFPALSVDRNDKIHVVFIEERAGAAGTEYYVNYTTNSSGAWSSPEELGQTYSPGEGGAPNIVTDSSNNPHVVFKGNTNSILYIKKSSGSWSSPVDITGGNGAWWALGGSSPRVLLAIDSSDNLYSSYSGIVSESSFGVFYVKKTPSGSWSTPEQVSETITGEILQLPSSIAVDSEGTVHIGYTFFGLNSVEYVAMGTQSETIDSTTNTQIAQKFTTSARMDSIYGVNLYQSSGGTLVGNVKIVTDNAGEPSNTVVGQKTNVTLDEDSESEITFDSPIAVSPNTTYWLVFEATSGSGTFEGGISGTADQVMYYDGSWKLSENIENMYFEVGGVTFDVYYASKSNGSWQIEDLTEDYSGFYFSPSITLSNNKVHIVYKAMENFFEATNMDILYTSKDKEGSTWSTPEKAASIDLSQIRGPEVLLNPLVLMYGSLHLGYIGENATIYYTQAQFQDGRQPINEEPINEEPINEEPINGEQKSQQQITQLPEAGSSIPQNLFLPMIFLPTLTLSVIKIRKLSKKKV